MIRRAEVLPVLRIRRMNRLNYHSVRHGMKVLVNVHVNPVLDDSTGRERNVFHPQQGQQMPEIRPVRDYGRRRVHTPGHFHGYDRRMRPVPGERVLVNVRNRGKHYVSVQNVHALLLELIELNVKLQAVRGYEAL